MLEWGAELSALKDRIGSVLSRKELRRSASDFIDGLLSDAERKTGWLLAEQAGLARPYRMQSLLGRSRWDADAVLAEMRSYVIEALGHPDGVLVVDETGFVKKGVHSVGVGRQYSGTAGRIENCQVGVFLAYAGPHGQALIDRRLYLPKDWARGYGPAGRGGCVPEDVTFAPKTQIARDLIARALDTGMACAWVLADALYGSDSGLRTMLEVRRQPYVLAVRSNLDLRLLTRDGLVQTDPAHLAASLPADAWARLAAGEGAKGLRLYDWGRFRLPWTCEEGFERWGPVLPFPGATPRNMPITWSLLRSARRSPKLAGAAGLRWTIEECFQRAKDDLGLDHCEARSWHGWHPPHDPRHGCRRLLGQTRC